MVIKVSAKPTKAVKNAGNRNDSAGSGKQAVVKSDYTGYFYNQIDRLWKEIMILQEANDKLRASKSGGP